MRRSGSSFFLYVRRATVKTVRFAALLTQIGPEIRCAASHELERQNMKERLIEVRRMITADPFHSNHKLGILPQNSDISFTECIRCFAVLLQTLGLVVVSRSLDHLTPHVYKEWMFDGNLLFPP